MKHYNTFFMQLTRELCKDDRIKELSAGAVKLFVWLNELEQRYCSDDLETFTHSDKQLAEELNVNIKTLQSWKRELKERAPDLIRIDKEQKRLSSKEIYTRYKILK